MIPAPTHDPIRAAYRTIARLKRTGETPAYCPDCRQLLRRVRSEVRCGCSRENERRRG